ncbi:MAG TPA: ATP-binding protein [Verrucomicrobiae bacterium]
MSDRLPNPILSPDKSAQKADRHIRDIIALSTLPSVWLGANPHRIAESLLAALDATITPDFAYVHIPGHDGDRETALALWRGGSDPVLAARMRPQIAEWMRDHNPQETLLLPSFAKALDLRVSAYSLGYDSSSGAVAIGFLGRDPDQMERTLLNITANHAITACKNTALIAQAESSKKEAETLNQVARTLVAELDIHKVVQKATDAATELTGAKFGAFFYNAINEDGEVFQLYTLSGAPKEAFERFGHPRATALFGPTFHGAPVVRCDDVTKDPRYGRMAPHHGMPAGHLPVCSYLAVPVISRTGEVLGGLFFGHPEPAKFTERSERFATSIAAQSAIAIDNARLYEQARRNSEQLEQTVAERTSELKKIIGDLESFSYSVSHDLRGPLRAMQGYAEELLAEAAPQLSETHKHYLQRIQRAAYRLDRLTQDVLAFSKLSRAQIALLPVDLDKLVRDIVEQYPNLRASGVQITITSSLHEVIGNEPFLTQAIANLLGNAVKFVHTGTNPKIEISSRKIEGDRVRLSITDNGIGIDPRHQSRIFQIFGRVHADDKYEGTGIGLAIVKKSVERMNGTVGFESHHGQGTCFWIDLPSPINQPEQNRS